MLSETLLKYIIGENHRQTARRAARPTAPNTLREDLTGQRMTEEGVMFVNSEGSGVLS